MFSDELDAFLFPLHRITAVSSIPRDITADLVSLVGEGFEPEVIQCGFPGSQEIGPAPGIDTRGLLGGDLDQRLRLTRIFSLHKPLLSLKLI